MKSKSKSTPKQSKPKRNPVPIPTPTADFDIPANLLGRLTTGRVSGAEVARLSGLSLQRACFLLRRGESPLEIVLKRRPGIVPNGKANGHAATAGAVDSRTFAELQRARMAADIERKRFDLSVRQGETVSLTQVRMIVMFLGSCLVAFKQEAFDLPGILCDQLSGQSSEEIRETLDRELRRVFQKVHDGCGKILARYGLTGEMLHMDGETEAKK
jgi:hypothetical protein